MFAKEKNLYQLNLTADYHTHTTYSHGKGSVADNAKVASQKNLEILAITDHAINHPLIGVSRRKYPVIRKDIEQVQKQYDNMQILMGIEANIIGMSGKIDVSEKDISSLDIVLAGFHLTAYQERFSDYFNLVWNGVSKMLCSSSSGQIRRNTIAFINAIKRNKIDILTHIGFRLDVNYKEISKACADYGTYVELSSRHKSPNDQTIEMVLDGGANFVINSDAHKSEHVGNCEFAVNLATKYEISLDRIANCNGKKLTLRSKS